MNYQDLSYKDMLNMIDENFYDKFPTKRKFFNFVRTFIDKFCIENNLLNVEVKIKSFSDFAMFYFAYQKTIYISEFYSKMYETFASDKNTFFLKNFFDSLIHELRHHEQYTSTSMTPLLKNYAVFSYDPYSRRVLDKIPYQTRPLELDARYYAYSTLKDYKFFSSYYKMEVYREDEEKVDYKGFNLVDLLKDKYFMKIKYLTPPKRALNACVKQIAVENGLSFVKVQDKQNDINLNEMIARELAPDFHLEKFYARRNSNKLERKLNKERNEFIDYWEDFAEKLHHKKEEIENDDNLEK